MFLLVLSISTQITQAQVDSKNWPKAYVDYFKQPRVLVAAHFTPVVGLPYTGLFMELMQV